MEKSPDKIRLFAKINIAFVVLALIISTFALSDVWNGWMFILTWISGVFGAVFLKVILDGFADLIENTNAVAWYASDYANRIEKEKNNK